MSVKVKMENVQESSRFSENGLTIRILFHDREVGNVIGKGGETIKIIRYQSGAGVRFTSVRNLERIATITGTTLEICKATELIGFKVKEFFERENFDWNGPKEPLTFKLIIPAYQCSFIIGEDGCKIKEIRESSGAYIQVSSDMLPNSTECLVSITGTSSTVSQCVHQVCNILLDSPRHSVIYYKLRKRTSGLARSAVSNDFGRHFQSVSLANFAAHGFGAISTGSINLAALHSAGSQLRTSYQQNHNGGGQQINQNFNSTTETLSMTVPNDLIGCIIGRNRSKITEMQLERHRANRKGANSFSSSNDESAIPLAQLFEKPVVINALSSLPTLGGLNYHFESSSGTNQFPPIQTTGFNHSKNYFSGNHSSSGQKTNEDMKFAPY